MADVPALAERADRSAARRPTRRLLLHRLGTLLWSLGAVSVLSGCAHGPLEPELLRRHASLIEVDDPDRVAITVHAAPLAPDVEETRLFRLSKSAQSELIESVAAKTTTLEELLDALAAPVVAGPDPASASSGLRFRRRVVVSAESRGGGPADRIADLRVVIALDTTEGRFVGWDRFVTEHATVEVGELALRRDREAGVDLDLVPGPGARTGHRATLTAGGSSRLDEALRVADATLSTGVLHPDSMVLRQRGAVARDLAGNSVVAVTVEAAASPSVTVHRLHGLFDERGRAAEAGGVRAVPRRLPVARPLPRGIRALVRFEALSRAVVPGRGDATFAEGDDHVRLLRTVGSGREVTLVPASELRASAWQLTDATCRRFLHLAGPASRPAVLLLASYEEAERLRRWLVGTGSHRVGSHELRLGDVPLRPTDASLLRVRLLPLNWDPGTDTSCT